MMLIYAALLSIPDEVIEAAECDGITGMAQFWKIKLPLILPSIGIISILTFVGNFNAFDLIYTAQGALAGPNFSTDILGTFLYRTFFGFQLQLGDPQHGRDDRHDDVPDHPRRRLRLPVRHPDAPASLPVLRGADMSTGTPPPCPAPIGAHAVLIAYTVIALFPVFLIVINSFKSRNAHLPLAADAADGRDLRPDRLHDRARRRATSSPISRTA